MPGRELDGVHFAMPFLTQQNRRVGGEPLKGVEPISAKGKHVIVIGGGDTGSDCVGTANRQGAASVTQLELLPRPAEELDKLLVWPNWPTRLRTSSSHQEGCERRWSVATKSFTGSDGVVQSLQGVEVEWTRDNGSWQMREVEGTEFELKADLVLLAMGFVSPVRDGLLRELDVEVDAQRQRRRRHRELPNERPRCLHRRRHAPRPIPRRLGHPRRPPMRKSGRRGAGGAVGPAAVVGGSGPLSWEKASLRLLRP